MMLMENLRALVGRDVDLHLKFTDGREKKYVGVKLLQAGDGAQGIVFDDGWWPRSTTWAEVVDCRETLT